MEWLFVIFIIFLAVYLYKKSRRDIFRTPPAPRDLSVLPEHFIVLDFETTGLNPSRHEIVEIGAIRANRDSDHHDTFHALIRPSRKLPSKITAITGITNDEVMNKGGPIGPELRALKEFVGDLPIVAYNADFDRSFLQTAATREGVIFPNEWVCALKLAREAFPGLSDYKLGTVAQAGGLNPEVGHRALPDCVTTLKIYAAAAVLSGQRAASRRNTGNDFNGNSTGSSRGSSYANSVPRIQSLKRQGRIEEAIEILISCIDATEKESRDIGNGWGVAPWYYEQLAIIYRRRKEFDKEVALLERYELQAKAPGIGPANLAERLIKARRKKALAEGTAG